MNTSLKVYYRDKQYGKAIVLNADAGGNLVTFIGLTPPAKAKKGAPLVLDVKTLERAAFAALYLECVYGNVSYFPARAAEELLQLKVIITPAALGHIEGVLDLDTRGKTTEQIRDEITRIAGDLPKGHPLREVPKQYPDRGAAIAAYTATRQALFSETQKKEKAMGTKPAAAAATETKPAEATAAAPAAGADTKPAAAATDGKGKGKATKGAKDLAKKGKKKAQDFTGSYVSAGKAATVKTTEELGMHEDSVRTKVLSVVMSSKAKGGVEYAKLEAVAAKKTRGAIAYLIKKGFVKKV